MKPRILIAPGCLKGSLSAPDAAACIANFLKARVSTSVELDVCPVADGGDDTLAVLEHVEPGFVRKTKSVTGPLPGVNVTAEYLIYPQRKIAVLEAAQAHGYQRLLTSHGLAPMEATSCGVGELFRAMTQETPELEQVIITLGGSASTDGGFGALQALGVELFDENNRRIDMPVGGGSLSRIHRVEWLKQWAYQGQIRIATDTINPLLGPFGTAEVFAPQKGATPEQCLLLENGLRQASRALIEVCGVDYTNVPGVGAAGGLAYGLRHLPRTGIISGSEWVAELLGISERLQASSVVITAEGRFDMTSFQGKAPGFLLMQAQDKPVFLLCGQIQPELPLSGNVQVFPFVAEPANPEQVATSMAQPEMALRQALESAWPKLQKLLE